MVGGGLAAHTQGDGNLPIGQASGDQPQHISFPTREAWCQGPVRTHPYRCEVMR